MTSKAGHTTSIRSEQVAAIFYKASCLINQDGIYILYCSLFWADISYCSETCGISYGANIRCMTVLQKLVVRLVRGVLVATDLPIFCREYRRPETGNRH